MKKIVFTLVVSMQLVVSICLNAQIGTWTKVATNAPHENSGVTLLLTDGRVICSNTSGGGDGKGWDILTPNINGSYINGTWSSTANMHNDRLAFASQILPNGDLWVAGGEYGAGDTASEIYNPLTNVWTRVHGIPSTGYEGGLYQIYDAPSELLYTGKVLVGPEVGTDPSYDCLSLNPATYSFTIAPDSYLNHDEAQWLKLPDSSVLFVGLETENSNRYIPQTNTWVHDANLPVPIFDVYGGESGCAFMLPNGKAIFFGAAQYNAFYTPSGNTHTNGTWAAAAEFPIIDGSYVGQVDAPGAMMVNGHILMAVSPIGTASNEYNAPTYFLEYDYTSNTFTQVTSIIPTVGADYISGALCQFTDLMNLPDGTVLFSNSEGGTLAQEYFIYTPGSPAIPQGKPTINSILPDGCPNYKLTGKLFNGISEGSAYGDDVQNATNYPIIRLTNGTDVYYARTTNWNRIGAVQTDSLEDTTEFTLPTIPAGTYSLVVVANGFASNPVLFSIFGISSVTSTNVSCSAVPGSGTLVASGGLSPYTYIWSDANTQTTSTASGLSAGTYSVTVSDLDGCTETASITITTPANLMIVNATITANANCMITGSDSAYVSGGTSPYTYMWSDATTQTTITATGLTAGTYTITVTDQTGCSGTASNTVTQPVVLNLITTVANVTCDGGANGSASVSVSGGVSPYTYLWNAASQTTVSATGLSAGTYIILVTDNNGCYQVANATITQPPLVTASANVVTNITCSNSNNGVVSVSASNGSMPYTYLWSDVGSQTTASASGLGAGTYTVTVEDNCGTSVTASVVLYAPASITVSATGTANVTCNGGNNGKATSAASGGRTPYTYLWSDANSQTTATASGLNAGVYIVSISDSCGNTETANVTITEPTALRLTIDSTNATDGLCNGTATAIPAGGTPPYSYVWSPIRQISSTISAKCAGAYCCTITDANGCTQSACTNIVTGIDNVQKGTDLITVYPNPNNGQFTIESSGISGQWSVEIYNILGEQVYSQLNPHHSPLTIDLSNEANGIYLYRAIDKNGALLGEGKLVITK